MTILKILHLADGADIEDITRHSLGGGNPQIVTVRSNKSFKTSMIGLGFNHLPLKLADIIDFTDADGGSRLR